MDEASKQDLRDQIAKQVWDFEINEQRGAKVSTGMAPWPDDARSQPYCQWAYRHADFTLPLVLRLITEAEGRVHAQAIAAAAAITETEITKLLSPEGHSPLVEIISKHTRRIIQSLSRPHAELRARIEVARAKRDAIEKCRTAVSSVFSPMGPQSQGLWNMFNEWVGTLDATITDLETKLAALDAKGGHSNECSH